jgi:hypothetical protein
MMPPTTSSGMYDTSKYVSMATTISEELRTLGLGKSLTNTNPIEITTLERLLNSAMDGIAGHSNQTTDLSVPAISGASALSIVTNLLNKNRKVPLNTIQVRFWIEKNLKLVAKLKKLQVGQTVLGGKLPGIRRLRTFLNDLAREGLAIQ